MYAQYDYELMHVVDINCCWQFDRSINKIDTMSNDFRIFIYYY